MIGFRIGVIDVKELEPWGCATQPCCVMFSSLIHSSVLMFRDSGNYGHSDYPGTYSAAPVLVAGCQREAKAVTFSSALQAGTQISHRNFTERKESNSYKSLLTKESDVVVVEGEFGIHIGEEYTARNPSIDCSRLISMYIG